MRSPPDPRLNPESVQVAFRALVEQTSPRLVRLSARILGDVREAEDVVQEAYMKAHQALQEGSFEERSSLATWLYRVVTRASIDALRTRKRRLGLTESGGLLPTMTLGAAEERLALRELSQWLQTLPKEQHEALILKALEGFTSAEVAEILECSEGAVEQRLVRARAALRERASEDELPPYLEGRLVRDPS